MLVFQICLSGKELQRQLKNTLKNTDADACCMVVADKIRCHKHNGSNKV